MFCGFVQECNRVASINPQERWLLDSGASKHMTNDIEMVHDLVPIKDIVKIGDGTTLQVTHKGNVLLQLNDQHKMKLNDVLVVPKLTKNLISETVLQKQNKIEKFGNEVKCYLLQTTVDNTPKFGDPLVLRNNDNENGSFKLTVEQRLQHANMTVNSLNNGKNTTKVDVTMAHQFLGHISMQSLK